MKIKFEVDQVCKSCGGTGLFSGIGERDGFFVQCLTCNGTGKYHFVHVYEKFVSREEAEDVKRVLENNPGIVAGGTDLEEFGGISYEDWKDGAGFPAGSEMRKYTCPAWWFQGSRRHEKPRWDQCLGVGMFASCEYFGVKDECWKRWDRELSAT